MTISRELISLEELPAHPELQHLRLKCNTIRKWLRRGVGGCKLVGFKVGRRWHIRLDDLFEFFQRLGDRRLSETQTPKTVQSSKDSDKLRSALRERGLI
jgi:hypothetical protein